MLPPASKKAPMRMVEGPSGTGDNSYRVGSLPGHEQRAIEHGDGLGRGLQGLRLLRQHLDVRGDLLGGMHLERVGWMIFVIGIRGRVLDASCGQF